MIPDAAQWYAVATASLFATLFFARIYQHSRTLLAFLYRLVLGHIVYPELVSRHRLLGPWSRAGVLLQLVLIGVNGFCLFFQFSSWRDASRRAGRLSLVNLAPAYGGPHLSFLADVFGVSLNTWRLVHATAGSLALLLLVFHVAAAFIGRVPFSLRLAGDMWGVVSASSLCLLALLSVPFVRGVSYEAFLRLHQTLAVTCFFAIWLHLKPDAFFSRMGVYATAIVFLSVLLLECVHLLYRNKAIGAGLSWAYLKDEGGVVRVRLHMSRPLSIKAGQYIGLWIPAVGFWSSLQSHPFTVVSWSDGEQDVLELLVEPQAGWTRKLRERAQANAMITRGRAEWGPAKHGIDIDQLQSHLAVFTGPHGRSVPVADYETVLLISSGFGICAQLPYLRQLIYSYNARKTRVRRVHLVWVLKSPDQIDAIGPSLNAALTDDTFDKGYILAISIYATSDEVREYIPGQRVQVYFGSAPNLEWHINKAQDETGKPDRMAVLVSAAGPIRDQVKKLVRSRVRDGVDLFELEYQPA